MATAIAITTHERPSQAEIEPLALPTDLRTGMGRGVANSTFAKAVTTSVFTALTNTRALV